MFRIKKSLLFAALLPLGMTTAHAGVIFEQGFGCDGGSDSSHSNYQNDQCGAATTPQSWTKSEPAADVDIYTSTDNSNTESIYIRSNRPGSANGGSTNPSLYGARLDEYNPSNFSVTAPSTAGPNWNIHDGDDNTYVSGYKSPNGATNMNMEGNMLGHENWNYDQGEANYYQISDLVLVGNATHELEFDFDSWISDDLVVWGYNHYHSDSDAFAVSILSMGQWQLLGDSASEQVAGSDMSYSSQKCDTALASLTGQNCASDETNILGFDGHESSMAGTALFDLSDFAGQTVSLRFAFASNTKVRSSDSSASIAEGINIDNIKVTTTCISGNEPGCNTPGGGDVPEPASLALALLGLAGVYQRRRQTA